MGMMDRIRGEFIDIVEWLDDSRDTLVWRFPRYHNEIKMGARLIVRESQVAVFVNEGTIADAFGPGMHTLHTRNLPVLSTIKGWKHGFESPFKAEVYFVSTRQFTDLKWGTQNPVIVRDPEFGMVRLRAYGAYALRITDARLLLKELVGTDPDFRTEEVADYLQQLIVGRLTSALASAQLSLLDLAAHQEAIGTQLTETLAGQVAPLGLHIPTVIVRNISAPPEVEQALDRRTQMGIIGDMQRYTAFQTANAIEDAARNPGAAGLGTGLGVGMLFGQRLGGAVEPSGSHPPPLPVAPQWYVGRNGNQEGPFDAGALAARIGAGTVTRETLVWRAGMAQWARAEEASELAQLFATMPPPMPR
ncbi:SPFH domain-containing protein [Actinoplanes sp. NPDC051859]|uniref:SPFH domain-containing protein n=1 Tax=Actinoplanes sp. NPDC051859 TaxID=3363909 RepID=UPI0037B893E8